MLDLSEQANQMGPLAARWDLWLTGWTPQPRYIGSLRVYANHNDDGNENVIKRKV